MGLTETAMTRTVRRRWRIRINAMTRTVISVFWLFAFWFALFIVVAIAHGAANTSGNTFGEAYERGFELGQSIGEEHRLLIVFGTYFVALTLQTTLTAFELLPGFRSGGDSTLKHVRYGICAAWLLSVVAVLLYEWSVVPRPSGNFVQAVVTQTGEAFSEERFGPFADLVPAAPKLMLGNLMIALFGPSVIAWATVGFVFQWAKALHVGKTK